MPPTAVTGVDLLPIGVPDESISCAVTWVSLSLITGFCQRSRSVTLGAIAKASRVFTVAGCWVITTSMAAPAARLISCDVAISVVLKVVLKFNCRPVAEAPLRPRLANVATPFEATAVAVPMMSRFVIDAVIVSALSATRLPAESRTSTTGWVPKAKPALAAAAGVVMASWVGSPWVIATVEVVSMWVPLIGKVPLVAVKRKP